VAVSRSSKLSRRWITLAAVLVISGCGIEAPQAPRWNVAIRVPIASRSFDLPYIIEHAGVSGLQWLADSGAYIRIERDLDTVFVGDHLSVAPVSSNSNLTVGPFDIGTNAQTSATLTLGELYEGPIGFIASFAAEARRTLPPMAGWDAVEVQSGQIRVAVANQLGITLDSVVVTLYNGGQSSPLLTIAVGGPIATGDSVAGNGPIRPGTVAPTWDFALRFYTPGGTILTADDKYVRVAAQLPSGLRVASATGIIPALAREFRDSLRISAEHSIRAAAFRSGHLSITWANRTPLPFDVLWTCPSLAHGGVPLAGYASVNPSGSFETSIDLAGYEFSDPASGSMALIQASAQSPGSSGSAVTMSSADGITITSDLRDLTLESATAALGATNQSVEWDSFALNLPAGLGAIGLDGGTCVLSVTSSLPWAARVSGHVSNENAVSIPVEGTVLPGSTGHPVISNLPVPGIAALLRPLSKEISFNATVEYGDGVSTGTIHASDFLLPRVILTSPASIYADSVSLSGDVLRADLSGNNDFNRSGRLVRGDLDVCVTNHLPLGATLTLKIGTDSASVTTQPRLMFGPSIISPAPTDGSGHATGESSTTLHFTIGSEDISLFERDTLWATGDLRLIGPGDGIPSRISMIDHIAWSASARLEVRSESGTQTGGTQ
jgi:hypothetical protein